MMTTDSAQIIAVQALGWMAGREDTLGAFLGTAGCAPEDLRARARDPEFLGFVLDFLVGDEAALMAFCDDCGLPYAAPMEARAALPGGDQWHWT